MAKKNLGNVSKIKSIFAQEVLDSRGFPTVMCEVWTSKGGYGRAIVPSGASTGTKEALELRDGDKRRYMGKGVLNAVNNVNNSIARKLQGMNPLKQKEIDLAMIELDGTENKTKLGANAILGVSLAVACAAANEQKIPLYSWIKKHYKLTTNLNYILPTPFFNIINGGAHADNNIDFQEYMIAPIGAKNFADAVRMASEVFHTLQKDLSAKGMNTAKGDEGGFAPAEIKNNEEPLELIISAIKTAGYVPGKDVSIALDCAATEFYDQDTKKYTVAGKKLTSDQMIDYLEKLASKYPIISIEDGLAEFDWAGFEKLTKQIGHKIQIVGDDLFVTNKKILEEGIAKKAANSILIKVNQIGTLTETIETIKLAKSNNFTTMISHRSGETEDTFIADLAVGTEALQIKTGSCSRSERIAKYNRLMYIEKEIGAVKAKYLGKAALKK